MGTCTERVVNHVVHFLAEWDSACKSVRKKILTEFIARSQHRTGPELETMFTQSASLFLARLTAWLKLTYINGDCLKEQLQALAIFLSATSGHKYVVEFLEMGGLLTLLDILELPRCEGEKKVMTLCCLQHVANSGRRYKELICQSYGILAVSSCMAKSSSGDTQEACRMLLLALAQGNPRFQRQVFRAVIGLLPCPSPKAQQLAANTLRILQPMIGDATKEIVEPLLGLLRSSCLHVHFEMTELLKTLMTADVANTILTRLVALLRPPQHKQRVDQRTADDSHPSFVQQASAAKVIGILAYDCEQTAMKLIQMRVIHNLLFAMGNTDHCPSQRSASITLEHFCRTVSIVDQQVREAMGETLYLLFMSDPEALYDHMTPLQADTLTSNKVNVPRAWKADRRT